MKVEVTVTNANEQMVMVTLDKVTPVVGIPVTASLTDPDRRRLQAHLAVEHRLTPTQRHMVTGVTSTG